MKISGSCHCGNIRYRFDWPGSEREIPTRACSCTFCLKHGAVYTSHPKGHLEARFNDERAVTRYRFGHRSADFVLCSTCGALAFATCEIDGVLHAVINVNTFDGVDPAILVPRVTDFEGETNNDRLARRKRNWTPQVQIVPG